MGNVSSAEIDFSGTIRNYRVVIDAVGQFVESHPIAAELCFEHSNVHLLDVTDSLDAPLMQVLFCDPIAGFWSFHLKNIQSRTNFYNVERPRTLASMNHELWLL